MQQQTNIFNTPKGKGERMTNSKALEALEGVKIALANHLVRQVGEKSFTFEKALKGLEADTDLQVIADTLTELEEIKKRAEEKHTELESKYARALIISMKAAGINEEVARENMGLTYKHNLIDYILKGETK